MRIIFHARSIHEGKGFKIGFFRCVAWLYDNHPRTLFANLHLIVDPTCERARSKKRDAAKAERKLAANKGVAVLDDEGEIEKAAEPEYPPRPHGSFDDLNDLLMLALNGQLTAAYLNKYTAIDGALAPSQAGEAFKKARLAATKGKGDTAKVRGLREPAFSEVAKLAREKHKAALADPNKVPISPLDLTDKLSKCGTKEMRTRVIKDRMATALADSKLKALYLAVVDLYASYLTADLARLKAHHEYLLLPEEKRREEGYGRAGSSPHLFGMSYAGKWAPTPGKSADRQLYVASAIALRLFGTQTAEVNVARHRFQKEVLAPLRSALSVPETKMVRGKWSIEYDKVPARAMARYKEHFYEHDPVGLEKYLLKVAQGKSSIAGAAMMPHVLLSEAMFGENLGARIADLQWASMVDSIRSSSNKELSNCIAVADVSGSMGHMWEVLKNSDHPYPIYVCIALTLLLSELARPPWNSTFITFSENPSVERIDSSLPLSKRGNNLSQASWGYNTDYNKVFRQILAAAKKNNVAPEEMVKKVFVFSDMQFDSSQGTRFGRTEHEQVALEYKEAGYDMPEMIYWNLQANVSKPVQADTPGTSLVSGFSGALMKYFIRELGEDPEEDVEMEEKDSIDDWDDVKAELEAAEGKATEGKGKEEEKKEKAQKTPFQHMMAIIGAKPFDGVVIVD